MLASDVYWWIMLFLKNKRELFTILLLFLIVLPILNHCEQLINILCHKKILPDDFLLLISIPLLLFIPSFRNKLLTLEGISLAIYFIIIRVSLIPSPTLTHFYGSKADPHLAFADLLLISFVFYLGTQKIVQKFIKNILFAICLYGIFNAIIAISQYFLQHAIGLHYFGEWPIFAGGSYSCITTPHNHFWFIDNIFNITRNSVHLLRAYGLFAHPNILAGVLTFTLIISYVLYEYSFNRQRLFIGIGVFLQIFALFITYSRSGIITCIISTILWFFILYWKKKPSKNLFILIFLSFTTCLFLFHEQLQNKSTLKSYIMITKQTDQERLTLQNFALEHIKQHPLVGIGYKQYITVTQKMFPECNILQPVHNIYLLIWTELGLIGFIAFATLILTLFYKAFKKLDNILVVTGLITMFAILLIGFADHYPYSYNGGIAIIFSSCALITLGLKQEVSAPVNTTTSVIS